MKSKHIARYGDFERWHEDALPDHIPVWRLFDGKEVTLRWFVAKLDYTGLRDWLNANCHGLYELGRRRRNASQICVWFELQRDATHAKMFFG